MKMRSGRIYKHDLSDIIGILIEENEKNIQELRNLYQQQTETEAENCRLLVQFEAENPGILNSENLTEIVENLRQS